MATGYAQLDNPNPYLDQYGWPRTSVSGVIGVHTTENLTDYEGPDSNDAAVTRYIGIRTDYGSYHITCDFDSITRQIPPNYAAWADTTNNVHAMSLSGALQASTWKDLDPARARQIVSNMAKAAYMLATDAISRGLLAAYPPARRITASEAIAGTKAGFYGHGETNPLTRTDPGKDFDWNFFLSEYARFVAGGGVDVAGTPEGDDMPLTNADLDNIANRVVSKLLNYDNTTRSDRSLYALHIDAGLNATDAKEYARQTLEAVNRLTETIEGLPRQVLAYKGKDETVDVYQKLNDVVSVITAGVDPTLTVSAAKSGAVKSAVARAAAITKTEPSAEV